MGVVSDRSKAVYQDIVARYEQDADCVFWDVRRLPC